MKRVSSEELSVLIHQYNGLRDHSSELYKEIEDQVLLYCYELPQKMLGLEEEDAAEFILEMKERIPTIIQAYSSDADDFLRFLFPILRFRIRDFYSRKEKDRKKQNILYDAHSGYEYLLSQTGQMEVAERRYSRNSAAERLRFVFSKSITAKRRFFIFLCSISPFIPVNMVEDVCSELGFDFEETLEITEYLRMKCSDLTKDCGN